MIAPTPLQWDSPKVVTRKIVPNVDMPLLPVEAKWPKGLRRSSYELSYLERLTSATSDAYHPSLGLLFESGKLRYSRTHASTTEQRRSVR